MNEEKLRQALKQSLSGTAFPAARQRAVWQQIKGEKPMKKKLSFALVCALTLLMAGTALAAALGVFGQFGLKKLEENAVDVNVQASFTPTFSPTAEPVTDYDRLMALQYDRSFTLDIHQAYCDGNKLYYSYTLQTSPLHEFSGQGLPTGVESWYMEEPGKRYEDVWTNADEQRDAAIRQHLSENKWYAYETWGLGDGARLADGTALNILAGDSRLLDECTLQGYQEVQLPDGFAAGDPLTFEVCILYGAQIVHQDETGVRQAHIVPPENRGILPLSVTVDLTGQTTVLTGAAAFEAYTAQVSLLISDVDISGTVQLTRKTPASQAADDLILSYALLADGQTLPNLDGGLRTTEEGVMEIGLRYDLPDDVSSLMLCPEYARTGVQQAEAILLTAP